MRWDECSELAALVNEGLSTWLHALHHCGGSVCVYTTHSRAQSQLMLDVGAGY